MTLALAREHVTRHLVRAERAAHGRDVSALDPLRRLVRALLLEELARYRRAERFPCNPDFAAPTPYFVDAVGPRCAVAHLLDVSGEGALVRRIARERNHARVHELADEPRLVAWLAAAGLSLDEAAAIQPSYTTTTDRAACVCGGQFGSFADESPFGTLPAAGVAVGTVLNTTGSDALVRVDTAYGDIDPFRVGGEIYAQPVWQSKQPTTGDTLLMAVGTLDADARLRVAGALLAQDGSYTCMSGGLKLGPLTQEQLAAALQADDCKRKLISYNPDWGDTVTTHSDVNPGGCSAAKALGREPDPTPIGILLALASVLLARRQLGR